MPDFSSVQSNKHLKYASASLVVALILVSGSCTTQNPAPSPKATPISFEEASNAKFTEMMVGAINRIALEYEVELDEIALRELLADSPDLELTGTQQFGIWVSDLWMDEGDYANELKESILDSGVSPRVWVQELADRLEP